MDREPENPIRICIVTSGGIILDYIKQEIIMAGMSACIVPAAEFEEYIIRKHDLAPTQLPYIVIKEKADLPNKQGYGFYRKFEKRKR